MDRFFESGAPAIMEYRLIAPGQPRSLRIVATALEIPEVRLLQAAIGWTELGLPREALEELNSLPAALQQHPDALEVRWIIFSELRDWNEAVRVSEQLIERAHDRATSWLHHAYALRRSSTGGLEAAFETLSSVASKFTSMPIIPYNLACYACQLGRDATEIMNWFERALQVGDAREMLEMALKDSDLEPVWPLIRQRLHGSDPSA